MNKQINIIVTGASGVIGTQVVNNLLKENYRVFALTRKKSQPYEHSNLIWTSWSDYLKDITPDLKIFSVVNLSTTYGHNNETLKEIINSNVTLTLGLFEHAVSLGAKKIINADSFFGKKEFNYQHLRGYIQSKDDLVKLTNQIIQDRKVAFINLRLEHVFGANDGPDKFVTRLIKDFHCKNKNIQLTDGKQKRDFIYIEDVVNAFNCVLKHDFLPGYKEFEVGTGKSQELKIFCLALAKVFNVPYDTLNFGSLDHRPNEIMDSSANNIDLKSIGWAPVWSLNSAMSDLAKKQRWLEN